MKTLLQVNASLNGAASQSSRLADDFVARWREAHAQSQVTVRDVANEAVPHLTAERFQAFITKPDERTAEQRAIVEYSDTLVGELQRADVIVLALPMYNFGVPSTLKAYFDHIARAGVTFRYTEQGPVGLLTGKKAVVVATRGGVYAGTAKDTQTGYVRDFLGFLGITDVEFVYAEGLAISEATKQAALTNAHAQIEALTQDEWKRAA
jgi:FMN-dependent NADH-azoreductase